MKFRENQSLHQDSASLEQTLDERKCRQLDLNQGSPVYQSLAPEGMALGEFTFYIAIFDELIQLLLHSKVAKAESYLLGGYHNE